MKWVCKCPQVCCLIPRIYSINVSLNWRGQAMWKKGTQGFRATPDPLCPWKEHWTRVRWRGFESQVCCELVRELSQVTLFSPSLSFPIKKKKNEGMCRNTGNPTWCSMMTYKGGIGGEIQEAGDIYICNYDRFSLMCGRDHHNIIKQLPSNKKKKKIKTQKKKRRACITSVFHLPIAE